MQFLQKEPVQKCNSNTLKTYRSCSSFIIHQERLEDYKSKNTVCPGIFQLKKNIWNRCLFCIINCPKAGYNEKRPEGHGKHLFICPLEPETYSEQTVHFEDEGSVHR